jgi:tape measure domain-containing protein
VASEEEVVILTRLAGTRQFLVNAEEMGAAVKELGVETETTGATFTRTGRRGFFMNQAIFTMRRLMYGVSLATIAAGVAAVKWGFDFNSTMQQARVALGPVFGDVGALNHELDYLFNFTKFTPFQFKDITVAFRQMYGAMQPLGISVSDVNRTIHSMVDALAFVGRTSPGALNRVAVALQHMAFQGRLTGQTTLQLARDGLPIYAALRKELGLTADQMHNVGKLGIPTSVVLRALNDYIAHTPGYANAAYRQATGSLRGLFTTFRDNVSQLMGAIEKGFFGRIQNRLVEMNSWFNRFSGTVRRGNMDAIVRSIAGAGGVLIWHQLAADIVLVAHSFEGLIRTLFSSHAVWGTVYAGLLLLHGILIPLNYLVHNYGGLLYVLIPLLIAWRVQTWALIAAERSAAFWTAVFNKETKALTFTEYLARMATKGLVYGYLLLNRAVAVAIARVVLLRSVDWGLVAAATAVAVAMKLQALWTGIMEAVEWLAVGATAALAVGIEALTLAIMTNPIGLLVEAATLLIVGLVILYMRWTAFHNLINNTFRWIATHWMLLGAILMGPFAVAVYAIVHYFGQIRHAASETFGWLWSKMQWLESGLRRLWKHIPGHGLLGSVLGHIPGLAVGGTIISPGLSLVGERGPELLTLPTGATVSPLPTLPSFASFSPQGERQPIIVQVVLNKKVLAEAYAEAYLDATARL